jgi:hypothetical protein
MGVRRRGRVVEGARLESEYTAKPYRGFESLRLRQKNLTHMSAILTVNSHNKKKAAPKKGAAKYGIKPVREESVPQM